MIAAKLLTSPIRQSVGPTTCRALAHTDVQFPDHTARRGPSTADLIKKTEGQRKVSPHKVTASDDDGLKVTRTRSSSTKPVPAPQLVTQYFNCFESYCQMIKDAKSRADRSILIDHGGLDRIDIMTELNNVEQIYSIDKETRLGRSRLSLIEFTNEDDAERVAKQARHNEGLLHVPLKIFGYDGPSSSSSSSRVSQQKLPFPVDEVKWTYMRELSTDFDNYTEFISNNVMSMMDLKMRFITLVNFERILCSGAFEEYELIPFGSSVIDLGSDLCDLDLVVTRKQDHHKFIKELLSSKENQYNQAPNSKLFHLDKRLYYEQNDPNGIRGPMKLFTDIIREFMPLADVDNQGVFALKYAKVPIIKFRSKITSLDCDLSFDLGLNHTVNNVFLTNYSGIIMSEIIYSLCRNNNIFSSVAIYLRLFGKMTSITSKSPNIGLTNFQFLSMILFYLQQKAIIPSQISKEKKYSTNSFDLDFELIDRKSKKQRPIVPSFKELLTEQSKYRQEDSLILDSDQLNQLIPVIVMDFFNFYSRFDFSRNVMNLYESKVEKKLDNSVIFVRNPFDEAHNICRNVNSQGLNHFIQQIRMASESCRTRETPLTLIKTLMIEYQKQVEKRSKRYLNKRYRDDLRGDHRSYTDDIAREVCLE